MFHLKPIVLLNLVFALVICPNCNVKFRFAKLCNFLENPSACLPVPLPSCKIVKTTRNEVRCPTWTCPVIQDIQNFNKFIKL